MNWMDRITAACKRFHYVISGAGTVLDIAGNNLQTPELESLKDDAAKIRGDWISVESGWDRSME